MAGARTQPDRESVLEGSVALPGAVRDPGLARHHRSLQANLHRGDLGTDPPVPHDGGVYGDLWPACQAPHRGGCALFSAGVCGDAALAVFQHGAEQLLRQSDYKRNLLTKVYFPRLIVPSAAVITSFVDFLISFMILAGLMLWYQWWPTWRLFTLPVLVAVAFAASMGAGLWLASLNVRYRDFRYVVPFLVQIGLYQSPVGFSSTIVPDKWQLVYALNPMVGVIEGFRWAIIGQGAFINPLGFGLSMAIVALLLVTGIRQFRRVEKRFADVI